MDVRILSTFSSKSKGIRVCAVHPYLRYAFCVDGDRAIVLDYQHNRIIQSFSLQVAAPGPGHLPSVRETRKCCRPTRLET
jgi:hypothetical protein